MPTINLSPKVRFALYLLGSLASLGVVYAVDKAWAGDAEVRLVQGLVALITLLAAANTNTTGQSVVSVPDMKVDGQQIADAVSEGIAKSGNGAARRSAH